MQETWDIDIFTSIIGSNSNELFFSKLERIPLDNLLE